MSPIPADVPDNLDEFPPVARLGGAIGRTATVACQQDQHDLCEGECWCRCHERLWYDKPLSPPTRWGNRD